MDKISFDMINVDPYEFQPKETCSNDMSQVFEGNNNGVNINNLIIEGDNNHVSFNFQQLAQAPVEEKVANQDANAYEDDRCANEIYKVGYCDTYCAYCASQGAEYDTSSLWRELPFVVKATTFILVLPFYKTGVFHKGTGRLINDPQIEYKEDLKPSQKQQVFKDEQVEHVSDWDKQLLELKKHENEIARIQQDTERIRMQSEANKLVSQRLAEQREADSAERAEKLREQKLEAKYAGENLPVDKTQKVNFYDLINS